MKSVTTKKQTSKKSITPTSIAIEAVKLSPTAQTVLAALNQKSPAYEGPLERYNSGGHHLDTSRPLYKLESIGTFLRSLRHEIDHGTGSGTAGEGESDYAIAHRLSAHDILSCVESELDNIEGFVRDVVSAAEAEAKAVAS